MLKKEKMNIFLVTLKKKKKTKKGNPVFKIERQQL